MSKIPMAAIDRCFSDFLLTISILRRKIQLGGNENINKINKYTRNIKLNTF